ncbi:hypothetical protein B0G77_0417 [Paraburkholderia sp. BL10I2N1]|nr:hypothetical protein B0G77_0417 [Paraburkholderia sp. BL10I2N1]
MKICASFMTALLTATCIAACSDTPPKPVLPDGSHRVPVNRAPLSVLPIAPPGAPHVELPVDGAAS